MTRTPRTADAVATTLDAAARLSPSPGYINGDDYGEWYIEAGPELLRALSQLALAHGSDTLAARLERLSNPLCMEPLDDVLTPGTMPQRWCGTPVEKAGDPCAQHTPEHAAGLGRCAWAGLDQVWAPRRICRDAPAAGDDRCPEHAEYCRAVKRDKKVCNRLNCTVPKHREAVAGR
ncbi:hypothetical protein QC334_37170 [Streptomyces sp. DH18]|uniref:hypothetical protein n=1 Tax=Streptomyces sp. DH18 TaxID=3040126 RepID=UPI0024426A0C|nr:hypothetical protein [Streptomyces sp. DH18]MDG9688296.1 hypothetical protein [Streptomyces sp. DH18]